jgi:hypothetical protein
MKLISSDDKLNFIELSPPSSLACQSYCGSRGSLTATEFDRKLKRRIRYLSRLKNSDEYTDAIGQYNMQSESD